MSLKIGKSGISLACHDFGSESVQFIALYSV